MPQKKPGPRKAGPSSPSGINIGADYSDEERDFFQAMDRYKRTRQRPFPGWREVLAVLKSRGWRRVADPGPLPRF